MLQTLQDNALYANRNKCEFGKSQLAYFGHVVSAQGVEVDSSKVQAMLQWPVPRNLKELQSFLGLTGYYRKFIAGYANISHPLTNQMKKDKHGWTNEATIAFNSLKQALVNALILAMPDFSKCFIVETDASGYGVGAVLLQDSHPITFYSKILGQSSTQVYIRKGTNDDRTDCAQVETLFIGTAFCHENGSAKLKIPNGATRSRTRVSKLGK